MYKPPVGDPSPPVLIPNQKSFLEEARVAGKGE
jgi:hypothetical protein